MSKIIDLAGKKFGRLTVLERAFSRNGCLFWLCRCDCGKFKNISRGALRNGGQKSCGCLLRKGNHLTHGFSKSKFYTCWVNMKARCLNRSHRNFKNYGGRGIKIEKSWLKFENFRNDMLKKCVEHVEKFGKKETSLDRIDVNGDYSEKNCRWATRKEQNNNARSNVFITFNKKTMTLTGWSKELGITVATLRERLLKENWSLEKILTPKNI